MGANSNQFNAAGSAAGYIYQARLALAEALRFAYLDSGVEVSIEKFDDVAFSEDGRPFELLQTKHHISKVGDLTDFSPDLWKTLRIWSEKVRADPSLPSRTRFSLFTTGTAPSGSVAALLRPAISGETRQIELAVSQLSGVIASSENNTLFLSFAAFGGLTSQMRHSLVNAIDVFDNAPSLIDLDKVIEDHLRMIAPRGKTAAARERLEGWWWARVAKALRATNVDSISVLEIESRLDDIREQMKRDSLPVDMDEVDIDGDQLLALDEMRFVQQLRLINLGAARIELAKRDFYRASAQRSRWTRENLLFDGEVGRFEKALIEEWQPRFYAMCDQLGEEPPPNDAKRAGQSLYYWVEAEARFPFRNVSHRFLSVGSYNILADDLRVGWHRDFATKLKKSETL